MEDFTYIDRIKKIIKMRHDDIVSAMASGGVDNMEKYQYMLGQIRTYQYTDTNVSIYKSGNIQPARKKGAKRQ